MNNTYTTNITKNPDLKDDVRYTNQIIQDAKISHITSIEQINLENLKAFLVSILQSYSKRFISDIELLSVLDCTNVCIHRRYMNDYPDTCYPDLSLDNPHSIGLSALNYKEEAVCRTNLPYDMAKEIIAYLETPVGMENQRHEKIEGYLLSKKAIR